MFDLRAPDREFVRTPSGLMLPERVAEARYFPKKPKAVEFFAGAGGMSCGFKQAGWHVVAACEYDCTAAITYAMNLCRYGDLTMHFVEDADRERMEKTLWKSFMSGGEKTFPTAGTGWIKNQPEISGTQHLFIGDVRKLTGQRILDAIGMKRGELDCVAGGPPCQGFSNSGKRDVMDPRNSLVFDYARLIIELQPKTMIMENVPGILSMVTPEGIPVVDAFARILEDGGFAGIDALKRTIAAQTGAVGIVRTKRSEKEKAKREAVEIASARTDQLALFDMTMGEAS